MQGQYRGDFTRDTFHPAKHFSRVLIQQGRVQLDADFNEQTAILLHYLQTLAADLIGPHGGPAVEGTDAAKDFRVELEAALTAEGDFLIGEGHYYVDGILCELDSPAVSFTVSTTSAKDIILQNTGVKELPFENEHYVEIFDVAAKFPSAIRKIANSGKSGNNTVLTLDEAPPSYQIPKVRHVCTYKTQPDYPVPNASTSQNPGEFLVYLDVWERHLTYVEDPNCREVALGGADTATRAKIVWQVKTSTAVSKTWTDGDWRALVSTNFQPDNRGFLKARVQPQTTSTDPCTVSPASAYRGTENQLYRVEINTGGAAKIATFKWSRENGSVVFPILGTGSGSTTITVGNLGRDERLGLTEGDWVEVVDDNSVLQNQPGMLLKVAGIDRSNLTVTLNAAASQTVSPGSAKHPLLRRWEQKSDPNAGGVPLASDGAVTIIEDTWIPLEDGIQVQFLKGGNYRTGDYWLIPARTATGDIQWPTTRSTQSGTPPIQAALPPHGVDHRYAPLALISGGKVSDLRHTFTTQAMASS